MSPPARTDETLRVSFDSPQSGWMSLGLTAGRRKFVTAVSHAPYDSLRELIEALVGLLEGRGPAVVRWNREPEEFDFVFRPEGERATLGVVRFPDHRRAAGTQVFAAGATREALCRAFWRELRQLRRRASDDEFESNWRRAFPDEELRRLTKALRGRRRRGTPALPRPDPHD